MAAGATLVMVFAVVVITVLVTDKPEVAALAAGVALFLVLVVLVASGLLSREELRELERFKSLVPGLHGRPQSPQPDSGTEQTHDKP
jgi:hypothetical protein